MDLTKKVALITGLCFVLGGLAPTLSYSAAKEKGYSTGANDGITMTVEAKKKKAKKAMKK